MIGLGVVLVLISVATPILSVRRAEPVAIKHDRPSKTAEKTSGEAD